MLGNQNVKERRRLSLRALVRRYPAILVDEAQDIGPIHQAILELLVKSGCQLSLIGDQQSGHLRFWERLENSLLITAHAQAFNLAV